MAEAFTDCAHPRVARRFAVKGIPEHRRPRLREVHANLVSSSGLERALDVRRPVEACDHSHVSNRRFSPANVRCKTQSVTGVTPILRVKSATLCFSDDNRFVGPLDAVRAKLFAEKITRLRRASDDHETARSLVEPVDNPRATRLPGCIIELFVRKESKRQKTVDECSVFVPARRMNDEACGLVHNDDILVEVNHVDNDGRIRHRSGRSRRQWVDEQPIPIANARRRSEGHSAERHPAFCNPTLKLGSGYRKRSGEEAIEPTPACFGGNDNLKALSAAHQSLDLTCPLALMRMSTRARS
jgi:hypothetical protein